MVIMVPWYPKKRRYTMKDFLIENVMSTEKLSLALVNSLRGIVWVADPKTFQFFFVSSHAETVLGYPSQQWLDEPDFWRDHTHPDDIAWCTSFCRDAVAKAENHDFKYRMIAADGHVVWLHDIVTVTYSEDEGVRLQGVMIDITAAKETEERLRLSEERFRLAMQGANDGLYDWNLVTNEVYFSPRWKSMLGYGEHELENHRDTWEHLIRPEDRDPTLALVQDFVTGRVGKFETEFRMRHKDGRYLILLSRAYLYRDDHGNAVRIVGTHVDITERKMLEIALQESEEQFRNLCEFAPIGIFRTDVDGKNTYVNPLWEEITELSAQEGMNDGWLNSVHPEDRDGILRGWQHATATGGFYSHECRILTPGGKTKRVRALGSPLKGANGTIKGYVGTLEDVSDFWQARQEIIRTQKLESLGLMAGGIAHDFNNILTGILGNVALARMQLPDAEKVAHRLESAEKATARARDLTQQLLTFARGGEPIKKIVEVSALLKEAAEFALHGSNVGCEFAMEEGIWPVEADEGQLIQVIHNLVLNAVQAMPEGGTVTIGASNATSEAGERYVRISVADTGIGMPEHHLLTIFDPYFTTKQHGSGLGLATCYSIIKKHGGRIRATSTLGKGSLFSISMPAAAGECASKPLCKSERFRASGHVLVMDDEEEVREIARTILEEFGFTVELAKDGSEAVELYQRGMEGGTPFSAVILDLTIPGGVGGREAIKGLLEMDPEVKAIVSSGYSNDPVMANYREHGFSAVLSKPYRPQDMNEVLQELLRS